MLLPRVEGQPRHIHTPVWGLGTGFKYNRGSILRLKTKLRLSHLTLLHSRDSHPPPHDFSFPLNSTLPQTPAPGRRHHQPSSQAPPFNHAVGHHGRQPENAQPFQVARNHHLQRGKLKQIQKQKPIFSTVAPATAFQPSSITITGPATLQQKPLIAPPSPESLKHAAPVCD
ncbi:hypothetical protein VIGAN_08298800 [Vigna angularis var. angularis]|uniref:Uncharacterized protein n=1 Tax=Vigna angularis var. angularis TaxID=157739 RepID=A0A0S3STD2_PHAAN|nr:hypothetical protein VIGAN_08298800 [Vigna angularis var. angularis]